MYSKTLTDMEIVINEKVWHFEAPPSIAGMLKQMGLTNSAGIAVAVNETIVQKSRWPEYILKEKDSITIIKATQGG
jgi:sulfur carrier protein